jgi:mycothiol synthase
MTRDAVVGDRAPEVAGGTLEILEAPEIPGLRFRAYGGPDDLPAIAELLNAAEIADGTYEIVSVEAIANELDHIDGFSAIRDVVLAEIHGQLVAIGQRRVAVRDGTPVYDSFGVVRPDRRRRGLGRALLRHAERAARLRAEAEGGTAGAQLGSWAFGETLGAIALLESEGYTVVRWFWEMELTDLGELPEAGLPDGLELRPVPTDRLRDVLVADWEAFQDHWGARPFSEADVGRILGDPRTDPTLWQVAWAGDEVAGSVLPAIYPEDNAASGVERGWLDRVSVRQPWRRRGVARALIVAALRELGTRGMERASLGVDAANPTGALGLYESLGFRAVRRGMAYRKSF